MKLLFVGSLANGATSLLRFRAFQRQNANTVALDSEGPNRDSIVGRIANKVKWNWGRPADKTLVNASLPRICETFQPHVVWIEKGITVHPRTLMSIANTCASSLIVHFNPDDPFGEYGGRYWRQFIETIPLYSLHFVPRLVNVNEYYRHGAKRVEFMIPSRAFDAEVHRVHTERSQITRLFESSVGFLGGPEPDRIEAIKLLVDSGVPVVLSRHWRGILKHRLARVVERDVRGSEYGAALSSIKIGLGFLRLQNRDLHTSRSIEIPASGSLLVAPRTHDHSALFIDNGEALFYDTLDEMVGIVHRMLGDGDARESIAAAGYKRCRSSGYDYDSLVRRFLRVIEQEYYQKNG